MKKKAKETWNCKNKLQDSQHYDHLDHHPADDIQYEVIHQNLNDKNAELIGQA